MSKLYAVIMAGGRGERFWPISTRERPKQFLSLLSRRAMVVEAVERVKDLIPYERILILTNARHAELVRRLVPEVPAANIVGEPVGRDTAPAVSLATGLVGRQGADAVFCVLTADHLIGDRDVFLRTLHACAQTAERNESLVTIGIRPTGPSTAYGYIEVAERISEIDGIAFFRALRFVEKPDAETARRYLKQGNFFWNSGMFVWRVDTIRKALQKHCPQLYEFSRRVTESADPAELLTAEVYGELEKISIDYAVMEKASNVITARAEFQWDDIGSWEAVGAHLPSDAAGNSFSGRVLFCDAQQCIAVNRGKLVALLGVRDLVVVQSDGVVLVCPRDRAQDVKRLVQHMEQSGTYEDVL